MTIIRPAEFGDVCNIALNLRPADERELRTATGKVPFNVLVEGWHTADICRVCEINGDLCSIFGVSASVADPNIGIAWMVGTPAIEKHWRAFLRPSRQEFNRLHDGRFHTLTNHVDIRNKLHHKWLIWCGCDFFPYLMPVNGHGFLQFFHHNQSCVPPQSPSPSPR